MGLLPALAWLLAFGILQRRFSRSLAVGLSGVAAFAWALVTVEGLSFFGQLHRAGVAMSWLLFAGGFVAYRFLQPAVLTRYRKHRSAEERWLCGFAAVSCGIVLSIGVLAAPNNWDSMTYHLPRVMQWAARGSVAFYETGISRQLSQPPGAEYALLHVYLLSGSDRLFGALQGAAGIMAAAAVWRIARALGATRVGASWALFVLATTPMALLQASSTQNDLVLAALLGWTLAFGLQFLSGRRALFGVATVASASLAVATKGTAWVLLPPLVLFLAGMALRKEWLRAVTGRNSLWLLPLRVVLLRVVLLSVVLLGLFAGPHLLRNDRAFGSPLGPDYGLANLISSPADVLLGGLANAAKNTAFALRTPVPAVNALLERGVHALHGFFGLDVNDGRFHWPASPGFSILRSSPGQWLHEDYAPNMALAWLLVLALAVISGSWLARRWGIRRAVENRREKDAGAVFGVPASAHLELTPESRVSPAAISIGGYALLLVASWLLFSALLRWQIWHSRLLLPLAVLAAAWLGVWLSQQRGLLRAAAALLLVTGALPVLLMNHSRPLLGPGSVLTTPREEQYFANRTDVYAGYRAAAAALRLHGAQHTLLYLSGDSWEYPLWVMARPNAPLNSGALLPGGEPATGLSTQLRKDEAALRPENIEKPTLLLYWKEELLARDTLVLAGESYLRTGAFSAAGAPGVYVREGFSAH